jgi:short-subunit dehydrogenase
MSAPRPARVLILGATSQIAEAIARLYAEDGAQLLLVGRNGKALEEIAADLIARGASAAEAHAFDLAETAPIAERFGALFKRFDGLDVVLILYADFADQITIDAAPERISAMLQANLVSTALWAHIAAGFLEQQRSGVLIAGGALAGDRGRASNYIYGAGKAGVATLMQGIAHRLYGSGARAGVVKFGPVASPMTRGQPGCAPASVAARQVKRAIENGAPAAFYVPWQWRFWMWPVRLMPDFIMHRTRL